MIKRGNKLAKAGIEFEQADGLLAGFHLVGFTICENQSGELFVLFPAAEILHTPRGVEKDSGDRVKAETGKPYYFLVPNSNELIEKLETAILDVYEAMIEKLNKPRMA